MSFRSTSLVVASLAMLGSLFAAAPAEAAAKVVSTTSVVAMSSSGYGKVLASCRSKKTCKGKIWIADAPSQARSFSIGARKSKYITFRYTPWKTKRVGTLKITGASSRRVTMEAPVAYGTISGTVARVGGPTASGVEVELWSIGTHKRDRLVSKRELAGGSSASFSFKVRMGVNNSASSKYKIHVTGTSDGQSRSWWWRGGNGSFAGGTREISSGSTVQVTRGAGYKFAANARYSSIKGTVTKGSGAVSGTEVTLIGRPPYWSKSSRVLADLDIMSCANVYGRDTTNSAGRYEIGFVPTSASRIYAVKSEDSQWNNRYGTCHAAVNYRKNKSSTPSMLALGNSVTQNLNTAAGRTAVTVRVSGYQGQSSTAKVDRYVTIREYSKGRAVLKSDVVRASQKDRTFSLGAGLYWVEVGRRTGCEAWYKSRYDNNNGYFNGLDRAFEKWKAQNHRMYRQHCRAYSAGTYKLVRVQGGAMTVGLKNAKGGWVSGRVTAAKIKPRTELMVRLTSSDGKKVYRTAMTDGGGRFKVTGLASGRYTVVVNADSWRGISRSFKGAHSVKVSRGKGKSVGTLRFTQ